MVFLLSTEGKKCRSDMHHTGYGGKKWEKMLLSVGVKVGKGDCPLSQPQLTY